MHTHTKAGDRIQTRRVELCAPQRATQFQLGQVAGPAWPKVVQQGDKVCVPKLDFSEQPDWRDHLWCFNKGDGSVR